MIQMLFAFLAVLLWASPALAQRAAGRMGRGPLNNDTWLIHGMVFSHYVSPVRPGPNTPAGADKHPPLWAQFYLPRSKIYREPQGLIHTHLPSSLDVYCSHNFQLADLKNNAWGNCKCYKEAASGEQNLSEETKSRLKWRMFDYKTNENSTSPFESITFQIVNTLNPKKYFTLSSQG
jgi:hypothetical protein